MENFTVLNYQGSKNNLSSFIHKNIEPYIQDGKAILDIFSGSAAVSNMFRDNYQVYANDAEIYASIIADAILNQADIDSAAELINALDIEYTTAIKKHAKPIIDFVKKEQIALDQGDYKQLIALYNLYPTVWNNQYSNITKNELTVNGIKQKHDFYLFTTYYATNYYGISQALDIDCLIKIINLRFSQYRNALLSCLFYAMKETVFSKDGHMAQPLSLEKNQARLFVQRQKNVYELFIKKFKEYITVPLSKFSGKNKVFNSNFEDLLDQKILSNVGLIYADPPYTEGRYQSKLSQRRSAKQSLENLIIFCAHNNTNLAISYAYPQDREKQATDRYTISIAYIMCDYMSLLYMYKVTISLIRKRKYLPLLLRLLPTEHLLWSRSAALTSPTIPITLAYP